MSRSALLKPARLLHLYLGVFTAPALTFFAFTGAVQTMSLHETTRGSNYTPPKILVELGQLHKKQTLVLPERRPQPPAPARIAPDNPASERSPEDKSASTPTTARPRQAQRPAAPNPTQNPNAPPARPKNLLPMKIFFVIVATGLLLSTLTGVYMSYRFARNRTAITAVLLAGVILPVLLTLF